jgi:hypothetical protein
MSLLDCSIPLPTKLLPPRPLFYFETFRAGQVDSVIRSESKETVALWKVNAALREADLGNAAYARQRLLIWFAKEPLDQVEPRIMSDSTSCQYLAYNHQWGEIWPTARR